MSEQLNAPNYEPANITAITEMSANAASGQKNIAVLNSASFTVGKPVVLGEGETAEIVQIQSLTDEQIVSVTNLKFDHLEGETVRELVGNAIRFFRTANVDGSVPDDADFSVLATVEIVADELSTSYLDSVGGSGYWYKFIYFDTFSGNEYTSLQDSVAVRGGNLGQYVTVDEVRSEAGLRDNPYVTDNFIMTKIVFAQAQVDSAVSKAGYTLPFDGTPTLIEQVTRTLAAGYVLRSKVLRNNEATIAQGDALVEEATAWLQELKDGNVILFGLDGAKLTQGSSVVSTAFGSDSEENEPWFTRDKQY